MAGSSGGKPKPGHDREFLPTPAEVTHALLDFWRPSSRAVWECACGDGRMAEVIKEHGYFVIASDIADRGYPGAGVRDFLSVTEAPPGGVAIFTNPPFKLAVKFIEHALGTLGVRELALILKAQFWHTDYGAVLYEKYPPAFTLPIAWRVDWLDGGSPVMDVSWNVWTLPALATLTRPLRRKPRPQRAKKGAPPA